MAYVQSIEQSRAAKIMEASAPRRFNGNSGRRSVGGDCRCGGVPSRDEVKQVQTMDAQTRRWLIAMCIAIAVFILAMALQYVP